MGGLQARQTYIPPLITWQRVTKTTQHKTQGWRLPTVVRTTTCAGAPTHTRHGCSPHQPLLQGASTATDALAELMPVHAQLS
jgi:hypothetical protein